MSGSPTFPFRLDVWLTFRLDVWLTQSGRNNGIVGLGVDEAEARRAAAAVELNSNSFQAYKIAMTLPAAGMGAAGAESERSTFVRGTIDIGDLQHYVWKSPSGTSSTCISTPR